MVAVATAATFISSKSFLFSSRHSSWRTCECFENINELSVTRVAQRYWSEAKLFTGLPSLSKVICGHMLNDYAFKKLCFIESCNGYIFLDFLHLRNIALFRPHTFTTLNPNLLHIRRLLTAKMTCNIDKVNGQNWSNTTWYFFMDHAEQAVKTYHSQRITTC